MRTFTLARADCDAFFNLSIARTYAVGIKLTFSKTFCVIVIAYVHASLCQMKFTR